ncbi:MULTISPECIES: NAD(P)-dependent oxidoreductase [unclassified Endozoicomonas]|uniref:NAD(P)-dependent oxidoreductase n=1 Tax=unclassified Endozoicomonas TaxID=2644528 RepID=UPI0021495DB2|nr:MULTISPECIES: NAD(P)-dependent oxidoreductase [unclassified Endozoicomonas]
MASKDIRNHRMSDEVYQENFSDIKPPLSFYQSRLEAGRCLYCHDAPCISACPTGINIPSFIHRIADQNVDGAAQVILEENILGGSCARVCPTEVLCEQACVRNHPPECKPVMIGRLQRFAIDHRQTAAHPFIRAQTTGRSVAVVGAGPAGLACAHKLARLGHDITVFDAHSKPGGLNEYGIAAYKLVEDYAQKEIRFIFEIGGITLEAGSRINLGHQLADLSVQFDAVFLGIGLESAKSLGLPDEPSEGVEEALGAIKTLRQTKNLAELPVASRVVVIGGGNTAIDIACQMRRLGAEEVTLAYRRGIQQMSATHHEQLFAKENGVRIIPWMKPTGFESKAGQLRGVRFVRTAEAPTGELIETGEQITMTADRAYKAIGQTITADSFAYGKLALSKNGKIRVNDQFRTSISNVWAGGDCVDKGEDLTVHAVQHGKLAAQAIHQFLQPPEVQVEQGDGRP